MQKLYLNKHFVQLKERYTLPRTSPPPISKYQFGGPLHQVDMGGISAQPSFRAEKVGVLPKHVGFSKDGPGVMRNPSTARYELPMDCITARRNLFGHQASERRVDSQSLPDDGLLR